MNTKLALKFSLAVLLLFMVIAGRYYWIKQQEKVALLKKIQQKASTTVAEDIYTKQIAQLRLLIAKAKTDEIRVAATKLLGMVAC